MDAAPAYYAGSVRLRVCTWLALGILGGCFQDEPPTFGGASSSSSTSGEPATTIGGMSTTSTSTTEVSTGDPLTSTTTTTGGTTTGGTTTSECPDGLEKRPFYTDADGDGFGAGEAVATECEAPPGTVEVGGDCDDTTAAVNPDADELCNGLVDDDCDGLLSELSPMNTSCNECVLGATKTATFWVCKGGYSFLTAEARCQKFGAAAHLANLADLAEHDLVLGLVKGQLPVPPPNNLKYWLGIHRVEALWNDCTAHAESAAWIGVDGTPVTFLPWSAVEPNNAMCLGTCTTMKLEDAACPRESCVELWMSAVGDYNDSNCLESTKNGHVCRAPL